MRWIDVNEDLPPPNTYVLVWFEEITISRKYDEVIMACLDPSNGWITYGDSKLTKVKQWCDMVLPLPTVKVTGVEVREDES